MRLGNLLSVKRIRKGVYVVMLKRTWALHINWHRIQKGITLSEKPRYKLCGKMVRSGRHPIYCSRTSGHEGECFGL